MALRRDEDTPLPLLSARTWAIGFLIFGVVLAIVFAVTMPDFFQAAYDGSSGG